MLENKPPRVIIETTVREHFQESVTNALNNQGIEAAAETTIYLTNLLTSFVHTKHFYERSEEGLGLKPLAFIYAEAVQGVSPEQRNRALRRLGDVALFIAGVFSESFSRKLVNINYYIAMGENAYSFLSENLGRSMRRPGLRDVFSELAEKFTDFVDVLGEVSEQTNATSSIDILRVYEVWLRTGSRRAAKRLRKFGIEPSAAATLAISH